MVNHFWAASCVVEVGFEASQNESEASISRGNNKGNSIRCRRTNILGATRKAQTRAVLKVPNFKTGLRVVS